jgi:hypothetical protein
MKLKLLCHSFHILIYCTSYQGKAFVVTGTGGIQQKQYQQRMEKIKFSFPYSTYNLNLPFGIICPTSFSKPDSMNPESDQNF